MPTPRSPLSHFSALEDPRQSWKVVYPVPEVLLIVLCGTLAGAEDFVEIRRWVDRKLDFLRSLLPFATGMPSHDTLNAVMNALPADLFSACFTAWVEALRRGDSEIVAIDGKTSRRALAPRLRLGQPAALRPRAGGGGRQAFYHQRRLISAGLCEPSARRP